MDAPPLTTGLPHQAPSIQLAMGDAAGMSAGAPSPCACPSHPLSGSLILPLDSSEPSRVNQLPLGHRGHEQQRQNWSSRPGRAPTGRPRPHRSPGPVLGNRHAHPRGRWREDSQAQVAKTRATGAHEWVPDADSHPLLKTPHVGGSRITKKACHPRHSPSGHPKVISISTGGFNFINVGEAGEAAPL